MEKIRVLFTIPNLDTAGSGMALYKLLTNLDRERFEPHVLCLHAQGRLFQKFAEAGLAMHVLDYTHKMRPVAAGLRHCWKVSRWIRKNGFKIVYSYHYSADYSEAVAAKMAGSKWVFVKKNMGWFGPSYRAWRLRSFLADSIIVQNSEMRRVFYAGSAKARLISIGVDTREFYELEKRPVHLLPFETAENAKIIGVVANFVPVKGLEILIEAFAALLAGGLDLRLVLIGDHENDYGRSLRDLVEKLKIPSEQIHFAGRQNNINEWLNTFDLFVQPTLDEGRREGAPVAVQEAVAAGTLVVGSRICGIEDQLAATPELLFTPGDAGALAEKMRLVFSLGGEETGRLKEKQKQHLNENYTLNDEVRAVEEHLAALVN
jgi:glycosyltransferase involved in cell wall biosynthesis